MCWRHLRYWRCRHYYIYLTECNEECKNYVPTPPQYIPTDCSEGCCEADIKLRDDEISNFERFHGLKPGQTFSMLPRNKGSRTMSSKDRDLSKELSQLKTFANASRARHIFGCCKEHTNGNLLSNQRRREMNWEQRPVRSIKLPDKWVQQGKSKRQNLEDSLDAWKKSDAYKKEQEDYDDKSGGNQPDKIPSNAVPKASGSSYYWKPYAPSAKPAQRQRDAEARRDKEEDKLAEELNPNLKERTSLGSGVRSGYEVISPSRPSSRESSGDPRLDFMSEFQESLMVIFLRVQARDFTGTVQEVHDLNRQLRRLRAHFEHVQPYGPDEDLHAADFVVRYQLVSDLQHELIALRSRIRRLAFEGRLPPAVDPSIIPLLTANDIAVAHHLIRLSRRVTHRKDDAPPEDDDLVAEVFRLQSDADRLQAARDRRIRRDQQREAANAAAATRSTSRGRGGDRSIEMPYRPPTQDGEQRPRTRGESQDRRTTSEERGIPTDQSQPRGRRNQPSGQQSSRQTSASALARSALDNEQNIRPSIEYRPATDAFGLEIDPAPVDPSQEPAGDHVEDDREARRLRTEDNEQRRRRRETTSSTPDSGSVAPRQPKKSKGPKDKEQDKRH